jgi:hypothetical protein
MNKLYILLACFLMLGSLSAYNWTDDGHGGVYWTMNNYTISAYPKISTMTGNSFYQFVNFTSANPNPITANLSFVFDEKPSSGSISIWRNETRRANASLFLANVTNYTNTTAACQIGDALNTLKYNVTQSGNNATSQVICFDSYTNVSNNYVLSFSYNNWVGWENILSQFYYTKVANHHVWTYNNVPFNGSTNYQTKFEYSFPQVVLRTANGATTSKSYNGKFDIYAHTGSPSDVVNGIGTTYVVLDPYYNSTGGSVAYDGAYTVVTFTANGTFNVTGEINATVLVVAGGGGGAGFAGGGGGAGGLIYNTSYNATGNITVIVGTGGTGGIGTQPGSIAGNGTNSTFGTLTAIGGGGGSSVQSSGSAGGNGGSGGGGGGYSAAPQTFGGNGTTGQGNDGGGNAGYVGAPYPAGGGGGAGAKGQNATGASTSGNGGIGLNYSINGSTVCYAGGGGGGIYQAAVGAAAGNATCGGGNGSIQLDASKSGTNGTGGGGGGSGEGNTGGAGGTGIVIIRYLTYVAPSFANLTVNAGTGGTALGNATNLNTTAGINSSINATASAGYSFANWTITSGNCTIGNTTNNVTTANFLNTTSNCVVLASFAENAPTNPLVNSFVNAMVGHSFTVNGSVTDLDGGTDITTVAITPSLGTCVQLSNSTSGTTFSVKFNCSSNVSGTANITIGFTDASTAYVNNSSTNAYPDHNASITKPTLPATIYTTDTVSCTFGAFSDIDSDTENVSARTYAWQYNGGATGITTATFNLNAYGANASANVSCSITSTNSTWATSNATNMSINVSLTFLYSPIITVQNTFVNSTAGHSFSVTAGAANPNPTGTIVGVNISSTAGTCVQQSNVSVGNSTNATYLCTATAYATTNITIGFTGSISGEYNQTTTSNNTYPDHAPTLTPPTITPALAHLNDTLTCNPGVFSDVDGDTENVSARVWAWYVNGVYTAATATLPSGAFTTYDNISCTENTSSTGWILTAQASSANFTNVLGFFYTSYGNTSGVVGIGAAFDYSADAMTTATGNADAFGLLIMATFFIGFYIIGSRYTQERALVYATFVTTVVAFLLVSGNFLSPNWLILSIIALLAAIYFANRVG